MTIDASRLRIDLREGERWRRTLNVTVPADVVSQERSKIASKLAGRLKMPGFRSGRIPRDVVEKRFGPSLHRQTIDQVVGDAYKEALRLESLAPISQGEVDSIEYEPDQDLSFSISFDVRPRIELARLGGFRVERPPTEVPEGEVDAVLERLREQEASWRPTDDASAPEDGDLVSVTVERIDEEGTDPQDYELVLGGGEAIPDVEGAIRQLTPGAEGEFSVRFPDDFPSAEKRGTEERLSIRLHERKVRELPELDDEFARSVGDFEDLDTLRARVREDLEKEAGGRSESAVRAALLDQLIDANPVEPPESMVEGYVEQLLGDTSDADPEKVEDAKGRIRPEAERAVKRILVIEGVADSQGLRATEEELDERIATIAARNDAPPAKVYAELQKSGRLQALERDITEQKVFDFLKGKSDIVDSV